MKRFLIPFVVFFLLWIPCGIAAAEEPIIVTVNGSRLLFDTDPITESDRTLVPVRAVSEGLNAQVDWLEGARRVVITADDSDIVYPYTALRPSDQALLADMIPELIQGYISDGLPALFEDLPVKETVSSGAESVAKLPTKLWNNAVSQMILELQLSSESYYSFDDALTLTDEEIQTAYRSIGAKYGCCAERILETFYRPNDIGTYDLWIHFLTGGTPYVTVSERDGIVIINPHTDTNIR